LPRTSARHTVLPFDQAVRSRRRMRWASSEPFDRWRAALPERPRGRCFGSIRSQAPLSFGQIRRSRRALGLGPPVRRRHARLGAGHPWICCWTPVRRPSRGRRFLGSRLAPRRQRWPRPHSTLSRGAYARWLQRSRPAACSRPAAQSAAATLSRVPSPRLGMPRAPALGACLDREMASALATNPLPSVRRAIAESVLPGRALYVERALRRARPAPLSPLRAGRARALRRTPLKRPSGVKEMTSASLALRICRGPGGSPRDPGLGVARDTKSHPVRDSCAVSWRRMSRGLHRRLSSRAGRIADAIEDTRSW
jgi:hypothetical protein